ncbi:MAG: hypothetical protein A2284_07950 [Deltaproteobacteria bacterium RIFOXYA12_FULL_61_11]|nr:MAG: hypothetical protein A2284_07950 [Deltaproteobacteria bacterium RIFOXYA12_FULL_61_11]
MHQRSASVLCLLCKAEPTSEEEADLGRRLAELRPAEWAELVRLAELNAVVPWVTKRLRILLPRAEAFLPRVFVEAAERASVAGSARLVQAAVLAKRFDEAGIPLIVLKGGLFAGEFYRDPGYKKMNDVDLLVHPDHVAAGLALFKELGLLSIGDLFGTYQPGATTHHTPPFISPDLALVTGLHWDLVSPHCRVRTDLVGLHSRLVRTVLGEAPVWRMSWEDNLFHLCIHLPYYKLGLRELADVSNLVLHAGTGFDWDLFSHLVARGRAEDDVYRCLTLADRLLPFAPPGDLLRRCRRQASALTRADTERRRLDLSLLLHSRSAHLAKIEKAFVVFRLAEQYRERSLAYLGMWLPALYPPRRELERIAALPPWASPLRRLGARLRMPFLLWRALGRDHGRLALGVVTARNFLDLVGATLAWPLRPPGRSLRKHPHIGVLERLE